jgi:outer membrane protein assembly factor BamC
VTVPRPARLLLALLAAAVLAGCSSIESTMAGDKVDYRTGGVKGQPLEVPPDLTQLARDNRYQSNAGVVSAAAIQSAGPAARSAAPATSTRVTPLPTPNLRIERAGDKRWLVTSMKPEQLWPQLQAFWKENGFTLTTDQADAGIMETEWAENRAKIPNDGLRALLGRALDSVYSTGDRDRYRTRVERTAEGSEVYITHRGAVEVYTNALRDQTVWQPRPPDPELEAEFLSRLMLKLGAREEQAKAAVAAPPPAQPPRARVIEGQPAATLQLDDSFDRAWRRVGVALDRGGFTVEDRDRAQGLYFVRYVDPKTAGQTEPGFFARMLTFGKGSEGPTGPARVRVFVQGQGETSTVAVLNAQGGPENGDVGKRIVALLVDELK